MNQIIELPSNSEVVPIGTFVPQAPEAATTISRGSITLAGDLGGVADTPVIVTNTVAKWNANQLQSRAIAITAPGNEQALKWNSSTLVWEPGTFVTSVPDATTTVKGIVRLANDLGGTALLPTIITNTVAKWNANRLQGRNISTAVPTTDQALKWNNATALWEPGTFITTLPDATTTAKGIVQLAGALGGTATAPTVPQLTTHLADVNNPHQTTASQVGNTTAQWNANQLQGRVVANTLPTNGQALKYNTTTNQWEPGDVAATGGSTVDASPSAKGVVQLTRDFGGTATSPLVVGIQSRNVANTAPTDGQALVWDNANNTWKPGTAGVTGGGASDATTTIKGLVKLAGDFSGTADLPVVAKIQTVPVHNLAPTDTQILTYVAANSRAEWKAATGGGTATPPANIIEVAISGTTFTSIQAAINTAVAGQTVVVFPGTYNEQIVLKNGVNIHLISGVKIRYSGTATSPMISDGAAACICTISGFGELEQAATGATKGETVKLGITGSELTLYCTKIRSTVAAGCLSLTAGLMRVYCDMIDCAATSIPAVYCAAGNQFVQAREILGAGTSLTGYTVAIQGGTQSIRTEFINKGVTSLANSTGAQTVEARVLFNNMVAGVVRSLGDCNQLIKNSKIIANSTAAGNYCVEKNAAVTNVRLQNCQLVGGQFSVYSPVAMSPVPMINSSTATVASGNIMFIGGSLILNSALT